MNIVSRWAAASVLLLVSVRVFAGFQSTETYLVAVGRAPGQFGAQIYSTVWATNLSGAPNSFTVYFLKQGQANTSPASFSDTLAAGETKIYENIVESKFHLSSVIGAARIVSSGEILVSERIYNQPSGADLGNTEGFFFAGVPKSFSISSGQSASIQGVNQGGTENFRSNFILVETGGASTTVNIQVFNAGGTQLGQKAYPLQAYEQFQANVADIVPSIATTNGRITATVTGGTGSVLLAGAQVANESQDASGFEMSFRDDLLGGGSSGLTAVAHDGTLVGNGTPTTPLGVNPAAVVTSLNGLHGAVTLAPGLNVTFTPSGQTITIASTGGGGGLTLPFAGTTSSDFAVFSITNSGHGNAVYGESMGDPGSWGVRGLSQVGTGVFGEGGYAGVRGESGSGIGVYGQSTHGVAAVYGLANSGFGVDGESSSGGFNAGVFGKDTSNGVGVYGSTANGTAYAVYGNSHGLGYAGYFDSNVNVNGTLSKSGGAFKIDHPLDPAHKYLSHSFVESPDMKNIYDGVVTLDAAGTVTIPLPEWFEALNRDFRYQLTAIGTPQPSLYVAGEIHENAFRIAGGVPGARVSWMVTGIRHDAWADAHRIPIEQVKPEQEQGTYLEPALFGEPEEKSVRSAKERQRAQEPLSKPDEIN